MAHVATVTIQSSEVDAALTDYRVYIDLSDLPASFWDVVANGGGDIRCFKDDGTTELAREVVSCDTATDTGELHVLYSGTLSNTVDTEIQIHADGVSSDYAVTATYGRNAVFNTSIAAVGYHYVGHMQTDATDSTGNTSPTLTGTATDGTGQIQGSQDGLSADSYYTMGSGTYSRPLTLQVWNKAIGIVGDAATRAVTLGDNSVADQQINLGTQADGFAFLNEQGSAGTAILGSTSLENAYHMLHGVFRSATNRELYVDGGSIGTNSTSSTPTGIDTARIGASADSTPFGRESCVDEVRIIYAALSTDWISTEYTNQNTPNTFYTVAAAGVTVAPSPLQNLSYQSAAFAAVRLNGVLQ